jgi:hypothetical protein
MDDIKRLQVGGRNFLQSSIPYVPIVSVLPAANDPITQNGSLIVLNNSGVYSIYNYDKSTNQWRQVGAAGTVTSFVANPNTIFNVANSTTTPTLTLINQNANLFLAGPSSGAAAPPAFRAIVGTDLPIILTKNITPVSVNANVTTDQILMTYSISAGVLNTVGKTLEFICYGNFDEVSGPTITFKIQLVSPTPTTVTILSWTPATASVSRSGLPFRVYGTIITASTGATGTLEAHGEVSCDGNITAGSSGSPMLDHNTAVTGAVDLTVAQTFQLTISFNAASVSNIGRQRMLLIKALN